MNLDELRGGPTYHVWVFRTGRCRILGPYAYHSYARDRDHEFTLYVSVIQGNGITALVDVGIASVAQMNRDAGFLMSQEIVQAPGLGGRWVGGHSVCSQFIYVNTQKGLAVFSGDTVQMYKNVELDDPVAICHDVVQCRQALALARADVDVLLPGHDPEILSRFPGGRVA